jgi:hypothetical protein
LSWRASLADDVQCRRVGNGNGPKATETGRKVITVHHCNAKFSQLDPWLTVDLDLLTDGRRRGSAQPPENYSIRIAIQFGRQPTQRAGSGGEVTHGRLRVLTQGRTRRQHADPGEEIGLGLGDELVEGFGERAQVSGERADLAVGISKELGEVLRRVLEIGRQRVGCTGHVESRRRLFQSVGTGCRRRTARLLTLVS